MAKLKRPSNVSKKLWRKASKKDREWIVWHEYLHDLHNRGVPGIGKTTIIRHTDDGRLYGIRFEDEPHGKIAEDFEATRIIAEKFFGEPEHDQRTVFLDEFDGNSGK